MILYSQGPWYLLARRERAVLLSPEVPADIARSIWMSLAGRDGLTAVIEQFTAVFGSDLNTLPAFIIVERREPGNEARVILRGEMTIRVHSEGAARPFSGVDVPTWADRVFPGVDLIEVGEAEPQLLAIVDGMTMAGAFRWSLQGAPDRPADEGRPPAQRMPQAPPAAQASLRPDAPLLPEAAPGARIDPPFSADTLIPSDTEHIAEETATGGLTAQTTGYEQLIFGETAQFSAEQAAVREEQDRAHAPESPDDMQLGLDGAASAPMQGDHDGATISAEQLAALQQHLASGAAASASARPPSRKVATLITSTGDRYRLDRTAVIGRRPQSVRATGEVPILVTVPSPSQDISRSHAEIRVEGDDVLAVDLGTTNGTILVRPGKDPVRLHPGEPTLLVPNDCLHIGDGVVISFEGLT